MLMDQTLHNKGEVCFCKMSRLVHKAETSPSGFISDFEKSLGRLLSKEYNQIAKSAVKKGVKAYTGKKSKAQVNKVMKAIDQEMAKFGSKSLQKTVEKSLEVFYAEMATRFIKKYKLKLDQKVEKAAEEAGVGISFSLMDKQAVEAVQRMTVQTSGKYFPDQLRNKTNEVIEEVILEKGLPFEAAAARLEAEVSGALGVKEAANAIPSRFATNPQAYFQTVASNASVTSTSIGRLVSMSEAGVERYRISAIIDPRTSDICLNLDGREFAVGTTMTAVSRFLSIQNFDELEGEEFAFTKDGSVPKWADEGLGFPPYHHRCRTMVVPIS